MQDYSPRMGHNVFLRADSINLNYGDLSPANFHQVHGGNNWVEGYFTSPGYNSQEDYRLRQLEFPNLIDEVTLEKQRAQREYAMRLNSN
jgi:hypothetical protein